MKNDRAAWGLMGLFVLGCGGTPEVRSDRAARPTTAPAIESLDVSASSITEGDDFEVIAVVSDADGLDQIAGGTLTTLDGRAYAAFSQLGAGLYSTTLSWADLHAMDAISFSPGQAPSRKLRAQFWDRDGAEATAEVSIALSCPNLPACDGRCVPVEALVPGWNEAGPSSLPFAEDFESAAEGVVPEHPFEVFGADSESQGVRVVSDDDSSKHLMFTKDASLGGDSWMPALHLVAGLYEPSRIRFSVRIEPGRDFYFAIRDVLAPPSGEWFMDHLQVKYDPASHELRVQGYGDSEPDFVFPEFPSGVWVPFTITQRRDAAGALLSDVSFELPGGATAEALGIGSSLGHGCATGRVVFVSNPHEASVSSGPVFALDDISIETTN